MPVVFVVPTRCAQHVAITSVSILTTLPGVARLIRSTVVELILQAAGDATECATGLHPFHEIGEVGISRMRAPFRQESRRQRPPRYATHLV